jgi:hypothetical protein
MEKLFYVSQRADFPSGIFGTLFECAQYILFMERTPGEEVPTPDVDDPLESLDQLLGFNSEVKYELLPAEAVLPRLLTVEEGSYIPGAPLDVVTVSDFREWLEGTDHDNATLRLMAEILYHRKIKVRLRGVVHDLGNSPLKPEQYDRLVAQLS